MQPVRSYKIRDAYNTIRSLSNTLLQASLKDDSATIKRTTKRPAF